MAITKNIAAWELAQQGLDPAEEHLSEVLELLEAADLVGQEQWGHFCGAVDSALQKKAAEDNGGTLPGDFTLPDWREYDAVLADCPDEVKNPPPLAPPDTTTPAPAPPAPPAPTEPDDDGPPPIIDPFDDGRPAAPPTRRARARAWLGDKASRARSWMGDHKRGLLAALVVCGLAVGAFILWPILFGNKEEPQADNGETSDDSKVVVTNPPDPPPVVDNTPPAPPAPVVNNSPPPPAPAPVTPKVSRDELTVTCDVSMSQVGNCTNVPTTCTVAASLVPQIQATCGSITLCSRSGREAAAPLGSNVAIELKKDWCKSS